ncbi:MAG: DUF3021 domain-containing protein [Lactobacillus sp.]
MGHIRQIFQYFLTGLEHGSTIYLVFLLFHLPSGVPTAMNIVTMMVMSGLIGLLSFLFRAEWASFWVLVLIHMILTFSIVLGAMVVNAWVVWNSPTYWLEFIGSYLIIYLIVWGMLFVTNQVQVKVINAALKKRQQKTDER